MSSLPPKPSFLPPKPFFLPPRPSSLPTKPTLLPGQPSILVSQLMFSAAFRFSPPALSTQSRTFLPGAGARMPTISIFLSESGDVQ